MNTNISSLQTIVAAIQNSESVVSVIPITKEMETVGYTIVFSKGGSVTVYYGYNGVIGEAGQEDSGAIPMIGVKKDADDIYYWTLNGEFIVIDGEKRPVYGLVNGSTSDSVVPRLKLENNDWYVTYDNGRTWERLGSAQGSKDGTMIRDISQDDDFVYVTLDDGEVITIAKEKKFDLVFAQTTDIGYMPGIGAKVNFTLTGDYAGVVVESVGDGGWKSRVCMNSDSEGYVDVTAPDGETTGKVLVFASDKKGYSTVKVLTFVDGVLQISSAQSFSRVDGKAQRLELSLHTNIGEYTVSIPESAKTWITVVDTRSGIVKTN